MDLEEYRDNHAVGIWESIEIIMLWGSGRV